VPKKKNAPDTTKKAQNFRFTPETVRKLEVASSEYGMSKTACTELALKIDSKRTESSDHKAALFLRIKLPNSSGCTCAAPRLGHGSGENGVAIALQLISEDRGSHQAQ
jgi:hypothetical protein